MTPTDPAVSLFVLTVLVTLWLALAVGLAWRLAGWLWRRWRRPGPPPVRLHPGLYHDRGPYQRPKHHR